MTKTVDIQIHGLQEALDYLKAKGKNVTSQVEKAISDSTKLLKSEIKDSIAGRKSEPRSVDTGEFLNSIDSKTSGFDGVVFSEVPQSLFMEYGTIRINERRHFRNSGARVKPQIESKVNSALKEI